MFDAVLLQNLAATGSSLRLAQGLFHVTPEVGVSPRRADAVRTRVPGLGQDSFSVLVCPEREGEFDVGG